MLLKAFGGWTPFPVRPDPRRDEFVNAVALIAGSFGGINLRTPSAPRCFEIERKLKENATSPVFHDDQHGTAVITWPGHQRPEGGGEGKEEVKVGHLRRRRAAVHCEAAPVRRLPQHHHDRPQRRHLRRSGQAQLIKEEMAQVTNLQRSRSPVPGHTGRGCVHRRSRPGRALTRQMVQSMNRDAVVCLRQPHPGDLPRGGGQGRRGLGGGHRPVRLSQPDQQRPGLPGIFRAPSTSARRSTTR